MTLVTSTGSDVTAQDRVINSWKFVAAPVTVQRWLLRPYVNRFLYPSLEVPVLPIQDPNLVEADSVSRRFNVDMLRDFR